MAKMNVTITKDYSTGKAQADAKAKMTEIIINAMVAEFGEDSVAMVRTGTSSQVNEIGVLMGDITDEGVTYDFVCTINPVIKGHKDRKIGRNWVEGTIFADIVKAYQNWVADNKAKAEARAEAKTKKIEADKARRAKAQAEKNAQGE